MSLLRRVTNFILQSRGRAFGVAFVCAYLPLLGSISILVTALVTLRKGAVEGALILFAATAPFLLKYYMQSLPADQANMALFAIVVVVLSNILVWLYAVLLQKYDNWSLILELSLILSVVVVGAVHFIYPDIQSWWDAQLTSYFNKTTATLNGSQNVDVAMQLQAINAIKPFATGILILSLLLNGLLQLVLARWWQIVIFGGALRKELYNIRFGNVVGILFVVMLLLSYWGNAIALDVRPVFYGLFCIAGLSLAHCLLASAKYSWFWIVLVYVALIVLFPMSLKIVAMFALLDVLLGLRQRLTRV